MPFFSMFVGMSMTSKEIFGSIVGYLEPLSSCEEPAIVKKKKNQSKQLSVTNSHKQAPKSWKSWADGSNNPLSCLSLIFPRKVIVENLYIK